VFLAENKLKELHSVALNLYVGHVQTLFHNENTCKTHVKVQGQMEIV